jgi:hypothetical protein
MGFQPMVAVLPQQKSAAVFAFTSISAETPTHRTANMGWKPM